ncbi:uncharacterized protein LOC128397830 isoform X4 [Panonychus citri]|nr:uncharacterized protein LOC128397830 isoform X2 [Panonychus citri]XP_053214567.1 uncharacterized protein LOC128397830 isoform X3 [Panonychus citri]XP_053214568.1 uncharacterized protein LOC128397830 isoform X4 [Panonychus citri]
MSGTSYSEEHMIGIDDKDDPYDLSLTLEDTEDDFNIEDITEDQVKELLADEENRFLLDEDEPTESTSSQINIIDRRVNNNDKSSVKGKTNDSKSYRNTGNLITIDCDDEDDEEESELDDRRHSKFKSERVIRNVDKKLEEKDIPETLEAVVLDSKDPSNGTNKQPVRGNVANNNNYHSQRGKGRNFMVPNARPFIGNNSISSMGLLPTPLQSFNRIHVNPNFKHLAAQGQRLGNPMEANNFRHIRPRGGGGGGGLHPPRLMGLPRQFGPRHVSTFEDMHSSGFHVNQMMSNDQIEALIASQSLDYEVEDQPSNHRFIPNNHNNPRPPLFNEPFVDNWSPNQSGIPNHGPWMQHPNRASSSMGNFQRIPGIFNSESNLRAPLLGSFQRGMQMNNSLFGNPPRHPHNMHNRLPHLTFFNQPNFPFIRQPMDIPRGRAPPRLESTPHPVPHNVQRHQIQMPLRYPMNAPIGVSQGQKRPQSNTRLSTHQDSKRQNNLNPVASTSTHKQNLGHSSRNTNQFKGPDSTSSPQSINKVTSSPGQRAPRPSTSNVNLKNIRPIKTVPSNTPSTIPSTATMTEARKAALLKMKAARRLLQKENMKARNATSSVKQVEVVDLITSTTPDQQSEDTNEQNKDEHQPMALDLDIDDEYKKKLEEQKRLREEIIRKKEERRKQMVADKMRQTSTTTSTTISSSTPTSTQSTNSTLTTGQQLRRTTLATTLIERASPSRDIQTMNEKRLTQSPLKRKTEESVTTIETKSQLPSDVRKVEIKGLAQTTTKATLTKLCTSVGPIENCVIDVTNAEKKAIVTFKSSQHARQFQSRYQRHLVDLCVIQVSLL